MLARAASSATSTSATEPSGTSRRPRSAGAPRRAASPTPGCPARRAISRRSCTSSRPTIRSFPMTSTAGSTPRSADVVRRAAVILHGKRERLGDAPDRLRLVAERAGVRLVERGHARDADLVVVLGGDGTILRALAEYLNSSVP